MSFSFICFINTWAGILIISMILYQLVKFLLFRFPILLASRVSKGHEGRYMALYTMSFSLAHYYSSQD
jgi:hypothetical protein